MSQSIRKCNVGTPNGPPPKTLREIGVARIVGRRISRWSSNLGSYGMGGCGIFGVCLESTPNYPEEWLILMLWRATEWLEIDEEVEGGRGLPIWWNTFSKLLVDSTILSADITDNSSIFILQNRTYKYGLEVAAPEGNEWNDEDSHLDAWAIAESETIYC